MSDKKSSEPGSNPTGKSRKIPAMGTVNPEPAKSREGTEDVVQGLQSVMAVIGEKYDPAVSASVDKTAGSDTGSAPAQASRLTDKIDAARQKQSEGSSVTQGLQSIMAVIGENYEEEPDPVSEAPKTPSQPPAASRDLPELPRVQATPTPPAQTTPPPQPQASSSQAQTPPPPDEAAPKTIEPAPQDSGNDEASSAISDLLPLLTEDEQGLSRSAEPVAGPQESEVQDAPAIEVPTSAIQMPATAGAARPEATISELLNQLKSDISTLERDNIDTRQQFNVPAVIDSASMEVKTLLAELQGDISALRSENETLKAQYKVPTVMAAGQGAEISLLLNQLQGDISGLRQENDALKNRAGQAGGGELSALLAQLQGDISGLRKENENYKAYYNNPNMRRGTSIGQAFLMSVGLLALVGGASLGGMYYANSINDRNNENLLALLGLQQAENKKTVLVAPPRATPAPAPAKPVQVAPKPEKPKVVAVAPPPKPPALPKVKVKRPNLDSAEVKALLVDAQNLIELGDLVSARQMLEYAMSQQSAEAAFRLAQTFDPLHLATMASVLSVEPNITRAKVLYYSAARQGHQAAAKRLAELRRTPAN